MKRIAVKYENAVKIYKKTHLGRVKKTYGLKGLSLDIAEGEVFGLLGLNGAGKTTAMKLITGLLFPTSGSVSVMGLPPSSSEAKVKIGYLPELPYFYPYLTPSESLSFYGRLSGMSLPLLKVKIPQTLERVGLAEHSNRRISEFS